MAGSTLCLTNMGYDWRTSDFTTLPAPDVPHTCSLPCAENYEYTAVTNKARQVNCDETWTLASDVNSKPHIRCVRQTVTISGPMNKAQSRRTTYTTNTATPVLDVDIGYRKIEMSAGWYLYKDSGTIPATAGAFAQANFYPSGTAAQ